MIDDEAELAVVRKQLQLVEEIIDSWRSKLLPGHPTNFAIYAEGAMDEAERLRAEIDEYLARRTASVSASPLPSNNVPSDQSSHERVG